MAIDRQLEQKMKEAVAEIQRLNTELETLRRTQLVFDQLFVDAKIAKTKYRQNERRIEQIKEDLRQLANVLQQEKNRIDDSLKKRAA